MNQIEVTFNKIILRVSDPLRWPYTKRITGKVEDRGAGIFEMALSVQNLHRIYQNFKDDLPVVRGSRRFLDQLTNKLRTYKEAKAKTLEIINKERFPVEPNGKFVPYAHQTKIIGVILNSQFAPVFSDCGTGKSGALGRAVEILISEGSITSGKVLVSAPLSILHTSWVDDLKRFTDLRYKVLWTPQTNKKILGSEETVLCDLGKKPDKYLTVKTKRGVKYQHKDTGEITSQLTVLHDKEGWVKYQAKWKSAITIDGEEIPFGPLTGKTAITETTKLNFIRDSLSDPDVDIFIINHDGVRIYEEQLKNHNFEWVIVDESTKIKSPTSKVSRAHTSISWNAKRRNILSGTPNPNGFIDLWHQFYFLDRGLTIESSLRDYLGEYFTGIPVGGFTRSARGGKQAVKYVIKGSEQKEQIINRVRGVGIHLRQRDCIDLPPRTDMRRVVYMTPEQEAAYDDMAEHLVVELQGKTVDAVNTLSKIMKLRQITSGFIMDRSGLPIPLKKNPKMEELSDFMDELGDGKCVVVAQFKEEIRRTLTEFNNYNAHAIQGGVKVEERNRIIREFQTSDSIQMVVLQPAAAAHGITLTAASHLVFLSLDWNFEYYYQVAKRIERLGQKNPIFVIHFLARYRDGTETIDETLLEIIRRKSADHSAFFDSNVSEIAAELTQTLIKQVEKRNAK